MDKTELYGEFFLKKITSSPFYRNLPLPIGEGKNIQIK